MDGIEIEKILKWAAVVFITGVIAGFGKLLAQRIARGRRKFPAPPPERAVSGAPGKGSPAEAKARKKEAKAEAKARKKEARAAADPREPDVEP